MSYMSLSPYTGKDNVTRKHGGEHKADVAAIDGEDAPPSVGGKARRGRMVAVVVAAAVVVLKGTRTTKTGSSNLRDVARRRELTSGGTAPRSIAVFRRKRGPNPLSRERSHRRRTSRMHL